MEGPLLKPIHFASSLPILGRIYENRNTTDISHSIKTELFQKNGGIYDVMINKKQFKCFFKGVVIKVTKIAVGHVNGCTANSGRDRNLGHIV